MINKVLFPATFVSEENAAAIHRRIGRFAVYQPVMGQTPAVLGGLFESGMIEIRHPVIGSESQIAKLCRAYGVWGDIHRKDAIHLNRLAGEGFYNQDFAVEISTEVRARAGDRSSGKPAGDASGDVQKPDPLFNARIFLQLAQEFDLHESEIAASLRDADNASRQIFETLRGGDAEPESEALFAFQHAFPGKDPKPHSTRDDSEAVMTESRLAAWTLLAANEIAPPELFVTGSRAVVDWLADRFPSMVLILKTDAANDPDTAESSFSGRFRELLEEPSLKASQKASPVEGVFSCLDRPAADGYRMEIHAIPGMSPREMLESITDNPEVGEGVDCRAKHCFICQVIRREG